LRLANRAINIIGTLLLDIIEELAVENDIEYIVGELQKDEFEEPLEKRKRFFQTNGFELFFSKLSDFSGWLIKKHLNLR
jgi:hypothetical protein